MCSETRRFIQSSNLVTAANFFLLQTSVLFRIENAKFWPISARLGHYLLFVENVRTFWCTFYRLKQCGDVPKMTKIEYT